MPSQKNKIISPLVFFLFFVTIILQGQSTNTYHHYTTKDGLPSNYVYGAIQDRDGYIWFYTEKGISKFDGYSFKNFQEGLPKYDVWGLTEDSKGRLWVHTIHDRLAYIYQDSIHEIKTPGNIRFYVDAFNETDGVIWFRSASSFKGNKNSYESFYIKNDTVIHMPVDYSNGVAAHHSIGKKLYISFQTLRNRIYLTKDSLYRYDYNGRKQAQKSVDIEGIEKYTISKYSVSYRKTKGHVFFLCGNRNSGLLKWDDKNEVGISKMYREVYDYPVDPLYSPGYMADSSFQVTLMPSPGFLEVDMDFNVLDTLSISNINFRRIFKDRQGNYWIATDDDGVYFMSADARNTKSYTIGKDNNIARMVGNEKGQIFLSTIKGGLYVLEENGEMIPLIASDQLGGNLKGLSLTEDGKIYAGADSEQVGFSIADPITESKFSYFKDLNITKAMNPLFPNANFRSDVYRYVKVNAYDEKNKTLWISNGKYIGYVDLSNPNAAAAAFIRLDAIYEIAIGKNNEIWVAGSGGVWLIKDHKLQGMQDIHPYFTQNVKSLVVDQNNTLWVATDRMGIFGFKSDSIYHIPNSKNRIANDLFFDQEGFLWAGTDRGVQQYEIDHSNFKDQKLIRTYNTNDGIISSEINAVFVDQQYIYAGTSKGLSKIDKLEKFGDNSPPLLKIQKIRINGKEKKISDKYILNHKQKAIEIDFVALSYKSLGAIDYRYQLEGVDEEWQETRNTTLRYASLSPGKYTFRLQAKDIENRAGELSQPLVFEISPPIWERTWFRILTMALIVGMIWLIYRSSINVIKKDEAKKTATAKKIAELELKALQSQMNPHFVFNALTSIRFYIQNNQPYEAGDYLARFAKLMRLFLESSKNNMASLDEEIKLISLYVEMEHLRFEKKFDFELTVDEDISIYLMKIPTLLLQPFVENAINHGLFHKEDKGLLKIDFQLEGEEVIVCTIEDDGIGREASGIIAKESTKGHKSRGMQIVGERLDVLKQKDGLDIQITFVDLKDELGENAGTQVVLRIPLLD